MAVKNIIKLSSVKDSVHPLYIDLAFININYILHKYLCLQVSTNLVIITSIFTPIMITKLLDAF